MKKIQNLAFAAMLSVLAVLFLGGSESAGPVQSHEGTFFCVPSISVASPAQESYMEHSTSNLTVAFPTVCTRTPQAGRTIQTAGFCSPAGTERQTLYLEAAPGRLADYFVFALEKILI